MNMKMKFHENVFKSFQERERTRFCNRPTEGQIDRQKVQFLASASRLMMLYTSIKFHENILNGFHVERTRNDHRKISKGNNSKNI